MHDIGRTQLEQQQPFGGYEGGGFESGEYQGEFESGEYQGEFESGEYQGEFGAGSTEGSSEAVSTKATNLRAASWRVPGYRRNWRARSARWRRWNSPPSSSR